MRPSSGQFDDHDGIAGAWRQPSSAGDESRIEEQGQGPSSEVGDLDLHRLSLGDPLLPLREPPTPRRLLGLDSRLGGTFAIPPGKVRADGQTSSEGNYGSDEQLPLAPFPPPQVVGGVTLQQQEGGHAALHLGDPRVTTEWARGERSPIPDREVLLTSPCPQQQHRAQGTPLGPERRAAVNAEVAAVGMPREAAVSVQQLQRSLQGMDGKLNSQRQRLDHWRKRCRHIEKELEEERHQRQQIAQETQQERDQLQAGLEDVQEQLDYARKVRVGMIGQHLDLCWKVTRNRDAIESDLESGLQKLEEAVAGLVTRAIALEQGYQQVITILGQLREDIKLIQGKQNQQRLGQIAVGAHGEHPHESTPQEEVCSECLPLLLPGGNVRHMLGCSRRAMPCPRGLAKGLESPILMSRAK